MGMGDILHINLMRGTLKDLHLMSACPPYPYLPKGEQSFFFQINSKTLILRIFFLNFIFSTTFPLINYRGIKGSFKNHI